MRLIEAIEMIRNAYSIPLNQFIQDDISTHSYYRYLNGNSDIKLSVALSIIKRSTISLPYFLKYMSIVGKENDAIDVLIEAWVNKKEHIEDVYALFEARDFDISDLTLTMTSSKDKKQILNEVSKMYDHVIVVVIGFFLGKISKETLLNVLGTYHHDVLYDLLDDQKALGILVCMHHFIPDKLKIKYKKLLTVASKDELFVHGSWDINEFMSMMLLNQPIHVYEKHVVPYEHHVTFISKKLYGSLDVGYIKHIYKHLMVLAYLKKDQKKLQKYALRYHMTMKCLNNNDTYLDEFKEIDILQLSQLALEAYYHS